MNNNRLRTFLEEKMATTPEGIFPETYAYNTAHGIFSGLEQSVLEEEVFGLLLETLKREKNYYEGSNMDRSLRKLLFNFYSLIIDDLNEINK